MEGVNPERCAHVFFHILSLLILLKSDYSHSFRLGDFVILLGSNVKDKMNNFYVGYTRNLF